MFSRNKQEPLPYLPDNTRVYCVGDIHGRDDLLKVVIEQIKKDILGYSGRIIMVFLGDYIDRGMHSREVIEILLKNSLSGVEYVYIRGNHEQTLLDFLFMDSVGRFWLNYGGLATLTSYGVKVNGIPGDTEGYIRIQQELKARIPDKHLVFLKNTKYSFELGAYFFVHAGVYPRLPLAKQLPEDMLWIRNEFLRSRRALEKIIVHGHTVVEEVEILPYRIGIDTGAYTTGILTCLVLQDDQQKLLQTGI